MITVNVIWFVLLLVILFAYMALDGFDLGVGILYLVEHDEKFKDTYRASIAPFWDGNEVWLITLVGGLFAAFPLAYGTLFSAFYIPIILLGLALIMRALALELRNLESWDWWRRLWDGCFSYGSLLIAFLLGLMVGNVQMGLPLDQNADFVGTFWDLLNPYALLNALLFVLLFLTHGSLYLSLKTESELKEKTLEFSNMSFWGVAPILFFILLIHPTASFRQALPFGLLFGLLIFGIFLSLYKKKAKLAFSLNTALIGLFVIFVGRSLFPFLVRVRGVMEGKNLTIYNASSSNLTLNVMLLVVILGLPLVLGYTFYVYRVFRGKASADY